MSDLPFIFAFDVSRAEVLTGRAARALADADFLPFWAAFRIARLAWLWGVTR
jgi:hypothetical protein